MSKQFWIHAGLTVGLAALTALTPAVAQFATHHPSWAGLILAVWGILGAALKPTAESK